jgi:uncharacterized protein
MATTYKTPDVYVEEISVFPPSVAEVATAIPAFIGYTETAKRKTEDDLKSKPIRITSLAEYEQQFGKTKAQALEFRLVTDETGTAVSVELGKSPELVFRMYYMLQMYFDNGGGPCYIVSVGNLENADPQTPLVPAFDDLKDGLSKLEKEDEPTLIVFPDATGLSKTDYFKLMQQSLMQCAALMDRFTIIDVFPETGKLDDDVAAFRSTLAADLNELKYGAVYYPYLKTALNYVHDDGQVTITEHKLLKDNAETEPDAADSVQGKTLEAFKTDKTAIYNAVRNELRDVRVELPPSGALAGIYARVDRSRGVWKAPANVAVSSAIGPVELVTSLQQENWNIDPTSGKSVNAIRAFSGKGTLVWGARTLAGNDNEWRYISVRRFFNMVEESVKKSTYWAVFEPNDSGTWIKVKSMIENYLIQKWRDGALMGAKPEHAFFVNVGLNVTMTQQDILEGRMIVEVGMAVVRPAEFIILKFSHKMIES